MRFANKVALITGAGSGVGAATAHLMAAEGARVAVMGRTAKTVEQTVQRIRDKGGRAVAIVGDVSKEADTDRAVEQVVNAFGRVDVVVSNAAVQLHTRDYPIHEQNLDAWEETQAINLRGAFLICRAGVRQMLAQGQGGAIVITGSVTALVASASFNPAYTASKGDSTRLGVLWPFSTRPRGSDATLLRRGRWSNHLMANRWIWQRARSVCCRRSHWAE